PFTIEQIRGALTSARTNARCTSVVLDELTARFLGAPRDADSGAERATAASASDTTGFAFGVALQLRGTALRNGELQPVWRDIRPTSEGDPPLVARADLRLSWSGGSRIMAVVDAYGQTDRRNDPGIRAR